MFSKKISKNFHYFHFFYSYLGYRMLIAFFLSCMVGLLDGLGLALFIPLLQTAAGQNTSAGPQDKLSTFVLEKMSINPTLLNIFLLIFFLFCLKGIFKFFESYMRVMYQQYFMRKIRLNNISLLNEYDYQKFVLADTGRIQNSLGAEINRVNGAYKQYFRALQMGVMVLVYIALAIGTEWRFTILILIGGFFLFLMFSMFYRRTKYFSKKFTSSSHSFHGLLMQKINNFQYLKATGLNFEFSKRLKRKIIELENYQQKLGIVEAIIGALREPFTILIVFLAIYIYAHYFDEVIGGIILSLLLLYRAITYLISMQEQWNLFLGNSGSIDNLEKFTLELASNKERSGESPFAGFKDSLKLINVKFGYNKTEMVLKNISLTIAKNETIAIVGESGSGKTTLMNLLAGLFYAQEGTYEIDGVSIEKFEINSFKNNLGYIVQNPAIFNDTVYNNISFWKPKTAENILRFENAAKKAAIHSYIEKLTEREDTQLGLNGINVSGGQKQRFSIARELFKDVQILFMDEATSNLDSGTEFEIQTNIANLKGQYTIIIIAHRLATIKSADRIVVLKNGNIEDIGTYEDLISSSSEFQRMVQLQEL